MFFKIISSDGSRPSTPSTPSSVYSGGTAQPDINLPVTTTYSTGTVDHMSSGRLIQQHQPVSTDQGPYEFATGATPGNFSAMQVLQSMATSMVPMDEGRQNSEQDIQAIVQDLMSVEAGAAGGAAQNVAGTVTANRVVVKPEPSGTFHFDLQFSSLETLDLDAFQDLSGQSMAYDVVFGQQPQQQEDNPMDVNNSSSTINTNKNNNKNPHSDTMG